jgi:hypothetical protein
MSMGARLGRAPINRMTENGGDRARAEEEQSLSTSA